MPDIPPFFVLTGGPGAGKSSVLDALAAQGYATAPEAGRRIIRDQVAIGGRALPWDDRALYAELMLAADMAEHGARRGLAGPAFFDRGVVDVLGYLRLERLEPPAHLWRALATFRYRSPVFVFPPWPEIYGTDRERKQDFATAAATHAAVAATYRNLGYRLVEVPRGAVAERAGFVAAEARR
jgi:predicted ATPase